MDFYQIRERSTKNGVVEVFPDFKVGRSKDLMVRGKSFYAIWDAEANMWSTDEYDVQRIVDTELMDYREKLLERTNGSVQVKLLREFSTRSWAQYRAFLQLLSDNAHQLDENLTFANTDVKKKDYVSRRLPYPLEKGSISAYDELIGTLYEPDERAKLEWAIGSILAGDGKDIQKFIVLYGEAGAGKSTMLNIIQKLFVGYYTTFEAKALTSSSNSFSTEVFKSNPLVAIQHDGDLSKIEDNTKLNSIISHEEMTMNEKYKPSYMARVNCFLFMATNRPVKITDAKSGIIRRLIDVKPSGKRIPSKHYQALMQQIDFELGAIAHHCLTTYRKMGKNYYSSYRPLDMMMQTDIFFNFVEDSFVIFKEENGITLKQAYEMYKLYCDESLIDFKLPRYKFREELKSYFESFSEITRVDGKQVRSYYEGFISDKFTSAEKTKEEHQLSLVLDSSTSLFDALRADSLAQYATSKETPGKKWEEVTTTLSDIDTSKIHYVRLPEEHIVIDFDLKDSKGKKSLEKNIEAASKWPPTYAEFSKSGKGVHLHYIYTEDVNKLSRVYDDDIEVKVFVGNSSLRRKLTKCNNIPLAKINSGLPLKGGTMINFEGVKSEIALRNLIKRNLNKEFHAGTKPSMDFIYKILEDAYASGLVYDVSDMRHQILVFANNSTNQAAYCTKIMGTMKFTSEKTEEAPLEYTTDDLIFYDVEVFPNLFVVVWKKAGKPAVKMINPSAHDIEGLLAFKLVGFNCRRYDNHILYGRLIGYTEAQLFALSQRIINGSRDALFREAYDISYTDVYDFSSKKQSLKKFEIELGLHHQELGYKWTDPVPKENWELVADYCVNDVEATEATFNARKQDFAARLILSDISGLTPNHTTQQLTAKIIFGDDPNPQSKFVYTDLSEMFPGYTFDYGKSTYLGENPGEGGYVYAEPGMYTNVALLDIASMHPTSLIAMNMFGPYTEKFKELKDARVTIKHKKLNEAKKMMNGVFAPYLKDKEAIDDLAYALKIVINSVYGLTSARFDNKFRDKRNKDNIVAKRGALFMIDLKRAVQDLGYTVAHIKTDSIKIPNADSKIIEYIIDFGKKYGYTFEHEETYDKLCLVNDAVYVAKSKGKEWVAVGAQFAQPYVFKTLFSKEPIEFDDLCETKAVSTSMYLYMNESSANTSVPPTFNDKLDNYHFIGKVGRFCPIKDGRGGGVLFREKEGKYYAVTGTKGYKWLEAEMVSKLDLAEVIDYDYYRKQVDKALAALSVFGDAEQFLD